MKIKTRTKIQRVMKTLPLLTDYGIGPPYGTRLRDRSKVIKQEKRKLLSSEEGFEAACDWMKDINKTVGINTKHNSYFLKHILERRLGIGHISNGVFIAAAIHCGFNYKIARHYPNVVFNMDQSSIQEKYEESLLYKKYPSLETNLGGATI